MALIAETHASSQAPPDTGGHAPRRLRTGWVALIAVVILATASGGYYGWGWYRTSQYRGQCEAARMAEDWRSQRDAAEAWAAWNPAAGEAWWFAAEAAQNLEDFEQLAAFLDRVPADDPKILFALVEKANLQWTVLNRPLEAVETSRRVLALDPRIVEVQSRLISFYAMNLQRAPMLKAIRAAIDAGAEPKESYPYLLMADVLSFSNGASMNSRWMASSPDELRFKIGLAVHTAMEIARNADIARKRDALELEQEANRQLEWFLQSTPHDPILLTHLMYRAYQAGNVERVGELLQQVDESGVDDHMVWVMRCWYHLSFNDFEEAEKAIQEALRLHPLSPRAHHEYANLLRKARRPETDVEREQKLAAAGTELRTQVLHLQSSLDAGPELLQKIAIYAEACGDQQVARALNRRLEPSFPAPLNISLDDE
jgi:tetratricopeptide (TPR) repeat protein